MFRVKPKSPLRRRAMTSIELIMVLVVLILTTFVSFQFAFALIVKQAVAHAATVAAREAAKGADEARIEQAIETILSGHGIEIGPDASFVLEDPTPGTVQGELPCSPPASPSIDGDEVRVTICVSLAVDPILNILEPYGIDYTSKTFSISAVATRE
jgi:hypothetical protein